MLHRLWFINQPSALPAGDLALLEFVNPFSNAQLLIRWGNKLQMQQQIVAAAPGLNQIPFGLATKVVRSSFFCALAAIRTECQGSGALLAILAGDVLVLAYLLGV